MLSKGVEGRFILSPGVLPGAPGVPAQVLLRLDRVEAVAGLPWGHCGRALQGLGRRERLIERPKRNSRARRLGMAQLQGAMHPLSQHALQDAGLGLRARLQPHLCLCILCQLLLCWLLLDGLPPGGLTLPVCSLGELRRCTEQSLEDQISLFIDKFPRCRSLRL